MSFTQNTLDASKQPELSCSMSSNPEALIDPQLGVIGSDVDDIASLSEFTIIESPPALDETRTSIEDTPASLDVTTTPAEPTIFLPDLSERIVHCVQYTSVPLTDMVYIAAEEQAREWYVVTRGIFLGVFKFSFQVDQATRKVSSAHGKKEDSLRDAVEHFNAARNSGWMRICTRPDL